MGPDVFFASRTQIQINSRTQTGNTRQPCHCFALSLRPLGQARRVSSGFAHRKPRRRGRRALPPGVLRRGAGSRSGAAPLGGDTIAGPQRLAARCPVGGFSEARSRRCTSECTMTLEHQSHLSHAQAMARHGTARRCTAWSADPGDPEEHRSRQLRKATRIVVWCILSLSCQKFSCRS